MALYNPHREYDKGMDDAYCGKEPHKNNGQYMEGYGRCLQLNKEEKDRLLYGEPQPHDMAACNALKEYDELCKPWDEMRELQRRGEIKHNPATLPSMQAIADKYNTTIKAMKEHWLCVEREDK